jgi:hypothetical protein
MSVSEGGLELLSDPKHLGMPYSLYLHFWVTSREVVDVQAIDRVGDHVRGAIV